ncbi:MAG: trypsin-like peptidase domain-containing protein [Planctomycetes bacterium]|nr:trypsin-like peptidase domain-containing protein [Planctomycetota bacterium]
MEIAGRRKWWRRLRRAWFAPVAAAGACVLAGGCARGEVLAPAPVLSPRDLVAGYVAGDSSPLGPAGLADGRGYGAVIRKVAPAVASLAVAQSGEFEILPDNLTTGSGVVVREDGCILTCDHVVEGAAAITVSLPGLGSAPGEVIGRDPLGDLAVVRADFGVPLPVAPLGDSDALQVGDVVLAFGNPFNISRRDAQPSVSQGIISALGRTTFPQNGRRRYLGAIQTDAAINPGNSGGPLVDLAGRVVGITGVISSRTGNNSGIGFALPVSQVRAVLPALLSGETVQHSYVGVVPADVPYDVKRRHEGRGVVLMDVIDGQPAALAGMAAGDLVTAVAGQEVRNTSDFINAIATLRPGDRVSITAQRAGEEKEFQVPVGRYPAR